MDQITHLYHGGTSARMGAHLRCINDNSNLVAEANPVCKRSYPHREGSFVVILHNIRGASNRIRLPGDETTLLPAPPVPAAKSPSSYFNIFLMGFRYMGQKQSFWPIYRKPINTPFRNVERLYDRSTRDSSNIRIVLESVKVRVIDYPCFG